MSASRETRMSLRRLSTSSTVSVHGQAPAARRTSSSASSRNSPNLSPKVQVVPHARTISFDMPLSREDRAILSKTNFSNVDISSKDFDFEDIFTYDKPQKKLTKVVEVSAPSRERDWSSFSFSHYPTSLASRHKVNNRSKSSVSEMYVRNQLDQANSRR